MAYDTISMTASMQRLSNHFWLNIGDLDDSQVFPS